MFLTDIHKIDCYFIYVRVHPSMHSYKLYLINDISDQDKEIVHQYVRYKLNYFYCINERLKGLVDKYCKIIDNQANVSVRSTYHYQIVKLQEDLSRIFDTLIYKDRIVLQEKRVHLSDLLKP